ncbi:hypothetical protein [Allosphingosinicella deserti]|uniref:Uncharacterized protein n=1 Tax=Allosphingosinicella deserti TaxID=2116704 RepID=A0A2P7QR74_9SPHN|nr:hypothetical protein [Sphingomonas deserti]PSJ40475.1 hypothetical protein C7I55_09055 [Sphingomonas deserti]
MSRLDLAAVRTAIDGSNLPLAEKEKLKQDIDHARAVPDTWVYRIVVIALGLAVFIPIAAVFIKDLDMASLLLPLATAAVGALAGILVPAP